MWAAAVFKCSVFFGTQVVLAETAFRLIQAACTWIKSSQRRRRRRQPPRPARRRSRPADAYGDDASARQPWWPLGIAWVIALGLAGIDRPKLMSVFSSASISPEIIFLWVIWRMYKMDESPMDQDNFLTGKPADLGVGMAFHYWTTFLEPLAMEKGPIGDDYSLKYRKILLIPNSCDFKKRDITLSSDGRLTKTTMKLVIHMPDFMINNRKPCELDVYRIVDTEEEEFTEYFFVYDFPQLLQSSLAGKKRISEIDRRRNLHNFVKEIKHLFKKYVKLDNVPIIEFNDTEPDFSLVNTILEHLRPRGDLKEIVCSSSSSDEQ